MAAGSSAPELFVSLADNVFSTPRSVGIGAIVGAGGIRPESGRDCRSDTRPGAATGSAIFNILIIIASTALLAGAPAAGVATPLDLGH